MRWREVFGALSALLLLCGAAYAARSEFTVTYRSSEHIYIDGGQSDGLEIGTRLVRVTRGTDSVFLEVVYTSLHSASCRPDPDTAVPDVGQKFTLLVNAHPAEPGDIAGISDSVATSGAPEVPVVAAPQSTYERTRIPARASGSVSFDVHHWADGAAPGLDYTQSTARLNLRVRRLFNQHLTLVARSRGRYEDRAPSYRSAATEWDNRLWELSLSYDDVDRPVYLSAGRIVVRQLPSAGYLDGALAEWRLKPSVRFGAFGGSRPAWLYPDGAASMSAYGGYVTLAGTGTGGFSVRQTAGAMSEYSGSEVNRSALLLTGHIRHGSAWGLYHTLEADLNTGWRKDAAGQSLSLSRAYVSFNWRAARWVRFTASYDNLKPYWTYAYRSMADSLFDNRVRQGFRLTTQWSLGRQLSVSLGSGYRSRSGGEDPTITYLASVRRTALGSRWFSLYVSMAGFDGPYEHGQTYRGQADFARPGWPRLRTGYGRYAYSVVGVEGSRASSSVDLGTDFDLWRTVYSGLWAEYNTGDDIKGWRLRAEIGYRL